MSWQGICEIYVYIIYDSKPPYIIYDIIYSLFNNHITIFKYLKVKSKNINRFYITFLIILSIFNIGLRVLISERSPTQPIPPQVLQQGGEREGRGVDRGWGGVLQEEAPEELWVREQVCWPSRSRNRKPIHDFMIKMNTVRPSPIGCGSLHL